MLRATRAATLRRGTGSQCAKPQTAKLSKIVISAALPACIPGLHKRSRAGIPVQCLELLPSAAAYEGLMEHTMADAKDLEDLAARLARTLPPSLRGLRSELEDNFRAVLRGRLEKLDLVSRERFEVQAELLARTQQRVAALEARLEQLEAQHGSPPVAPPATTH